MVKKRLPQGLEFSLDPGAERPAGGARAHDHLVARAVVPQRDHPSRPHPPVHADHRPGAADLRRTQDRDRVRRDPEAVLALAAGHFARALSAI